MRYAWLTIDTYGRRINNLHGCCDEFFGDFDQSKSLKQTDGFTNSDSSSQENSNNNSQTQKTLVFILSIKRVYVIDTIETTQQETNVRFKYL
jgi:hypothetical protein